MANKAAHTPFMLAVAVFASTWWATHGVAPAFAGTVVRLGESDAGQIKTARRGDQVELQLAGNPTTGFSWKVSSIEGKSLKQSGDVHYTANKPVMPGSPGVFTARFKAVSTGSSTVNMQYVRPWEKDTTPARTFSVTIDVK